jgi:hypothetical protein
MSYFYFFSKYIEYNSEKKAFLKIFFFIKNMLAGINFIFIFAPAFRDGYPLGIMAR